MARGCFTVREASLSFALPPPASLPLSARPFPRSSIFLFLSVPLCVRARTGCIDRYWTLMCFLHKIHLRSHKLATETDASLPLATHPLRAPPIHRPSSRCSRDGQKQPGGAYLRQILPNCATTTTAEPSTSRINSFFNESICTLFHPPELNISTTVNRTSTALLFHRFVSYLSFEKRKFH